MQTVTFRLLHLSDLHLDRVFAGMGCQGELARRRRLGLREALVRAGESAQESGCSAITLGGDLFEHDRSGPDTAQFLADLFASWDPLPVFIAPGNHDPLLPGSIYLRTAWPGNVRIFKESKLEPVRLEDGLNLWGLGHQEPAWTGDPLGFPAPVSNGEINLALFHGAELGSRPEGKSLHGPFRAVRIRESGFAAALCGHYHSRRLDDKNMLCYPGTPEPLAFDENGRRGAVMVEIEPSGTVTFKPLDLNRWFAETVLCELDGVTNTTTAIDRMCATVLASTAGLPLDHTLIRLDLQGNIPSAVALDRFDIEAAVRDATGVAALRVNDSTVNQLSSEELAGEQTSRGAFVRAARQAIESAGDAAEKAVLEDALRYGLQALHGAEVGLR